MAPIKVKNLEGHYTIKRVPKLPKRGNSNWLYVLDGDTIDEGYIWNLKNEWETITIGGGGGGIESVTSGTNVTITGTGTLADPLIINAVQASVPIKQNDTIGSIYWDYFRDENNFGDQGFGSVDLSLSFSPSTVLGSTGQYSFAAGIDVQASGYGSFGHGQEISSLSTFGATFGYQNSNNSYAGFVAGYSNQLTGEGYGSVFGINNTSDTNGGIMAGVDLLSTSGVGTAIFGAANVDLGGANNGNSLTQPIIIVGNGTHTTPVGAPWTAISRSNLLVGLRNGQVTLPSTTISTIDAEPTGKQILTREWYEAQPSGGSVERTAYINTSSGNDGTAELGNDVLPFQTLSAAHAALPTSEAERRQLWKIIYLNNTGTETVTTSFQERNLLITSENFAGTINFDPASGVIFENPGSNVYNIEIDLPQATLGSTNNTTNATWTFDQGVYKITCNTFNLDNSTFNFGYFRGQPNGSYELNFNLLTLSATQGSVFGNNSGGPKIDVVNIGKVEDSSNVTHDFGREGIILDIGEYEKLGTGTVSIVEGGVYSKLKIGKFSGVGTGLMILSDDQDVGGVTEFDFQGTEIETIGYSIIANVDPTGDYYLRGAMKTYGQGIQVRAGSTNATSVNFERFRGRTQSSISTTQTQTINVTDSHLVCSSNCFTANAGVVNDVNFYGVNSIVLDDNVGDEVVFNAGAGQTVDIYGSLHTNTATLGLNVTANVLTTNIYQ